MYESIPHTIIITLGNKLHKIPEVASPITISFISAKKCNKIISQTEKFVLFFIHSQSKGKIVATSMVHGKVSSTQQKWVDKVVEEYKDIFSSPTGVPLHF